MFLIYILPCDSSFFQYDMTSPNFHCILWWPAYDSALLPSALLIWLSWLPSYWVDIVQSALLLNKIKTHLDYVQKYYSKTGLLDSSKLFFPGT